MLGHSAFLNILYTRIHLCYFRRKKYGKQKLHHRALDRRSESEA